MASVETTELEQTRERQRTASGVRVGALPYLLVAPAAVVVALVVALPMLYSLALSFTSFTMVKPQANFVGLENYLRLIRDAVFQRALINTLIFVTVAVNLEMILGLAIAQLMARATRGQGLARTILMMPMMFAPILVGFQFKWFFNDQVGLVNNLLTSITGRNVVIGWLVDVPLGMISLLVAEIWMSTPFMVIVFLAGLMSLPQEPFEAAEVDGASAWQKFLYITYPLLTPFIYIALAVRSLDIGRAYDVVRIMTDGGPANRTELIWTYVFRLSFTQNEFALGSAMSFITVIISFAFTIYLFRQLLKARRV